jgi:hypothetical protein
MNKPRIGEKYFKEDFMKKFIGLLIMAGVFSTAVFAQEGGQHKYEPFDMLIGINLGSGGAIAGNLMKPDGSTGNGSLIFTFDTGFTYDFYIFYWLSVNTGLLFHQQVLAIWKEEYNDMSDSLFNFLQDPFCLTIPLQAHVNVPRAEWLYAGLGVSINIPLFSYTEKMAEFWGVREEGRSRKGKTFFALPIDLGFEIENLSKGESRFFFRFTPTFIEGTALFPIGFIWQIYKFRIDTK